LPEQLQLQRWDTIEMRPGFLHCGRDAELDSRGDVSGGYESNAADQERYGDSGWRLRNMTNPQLSIEDSRYDLLSFAGEDRPYVEGIAGSIPALATIFKFPREFDGFRVRPMNSGKK
jgi:hypothetical protein